MNLSLSSLRLLLSCLACSSSALCASRCSVTLSSSPSHSLPTSPSSHRNALLSRGSCLSLVMFLRVEQAYCSKQNEKEHWTVIIYAGINSIKLPRPLSMTLPHPLPYGCHSDTSRLLTTRVGGRRISPRTSLSSSCRASLSINCSGSRAPWSCLLASNSRGFPLILSSFKVFLITSFASSILS